MDSTEAGLLQVAAKKKLGRPPYKHLQHKQDDSPTVVEPVLRTALDDTALERQERIPFGGFTYKLEVANKDPNFFYYWQKDVGDNINRMLRAGYEFVSARDHGSETLTNQDVHGGNQSLTDRYERNGGRDEFGRHYNLVLMRQPMEFHLADKKLEEKLADDIDMAIRRQPQGVNAYGAIDMNKGRE